MSAAMPAAHFGECPRRDPGQALRAAVIAIIAFLLGVSSALAHDLIGSAGVEEYLERIDEINATISKGNSVEQRADAFFALGDTVDGLTGILYRDVAAHGELGLASTVLVNELEARGIELSYWPEARRYKSYLAPFEQYVALLSEGPKRADALFRIIQGQFYDSFIYDPLQPVDLDWPGLLARIKDAESFLARYPEHAGREEVQFIVAVGYVRVVKQAPDAQASLAYKERARTALAEFQDNYPDSMRAVAAEVLMEGLATAD